MFGSRCDQNYIYGILFMGNYFNVVQLKFRILQKLSRGVFGNLSVSKLLAAHYFRKKFHFICFTEFWILLFYSLLWIQNIDKTPKCKFIGTERIQKYLIPIIVLLICCRSFRLNGEHRVYPSLFID